MQIQIIGAGGVALDILSCFSDEVTFSGIWDDQQPSAWITQKIPYLGHTDNIVQSPNTQFIIAIANPLVRKKIFEKNKHLTFKTLIHSSVKLYNPSTIQIEEGCILMPHVYITGYVLLAQNVFMHINSGVHHEVQIGAHSVLMPGSRITCACNIGLASKLQTNITISKHIKTSDYQTFNVSEL
ncbi:MAG: hypothetical protein R2831_02755 [Chitinophagaceae bacterium]